MFAMTSRALSQLARYSAAMLMLLLASPHTFAQAQPNSSATSGRMLGAKQTVYPDWFKQSFLDFRADIAEAAQAGKTVILLFHQDGCPYCNALVERNLSQRKIEQKLRDKFEIVALNIWGDRDIVSVSGQSFTEKEFAAALKVQFTPSLLFFDAQANLALRLDGYLPPREFSAALDYIASDASKTKSYQAFLKARAPAKARPSARAPSAPINLANLPRDKPTLIVFEQADCAACDDLREQVLGALETQAQLAKFHQVRLDMWSHTALTTPRGESTTVRAWVDALKLKYAPSLVLFDALGSEVIRADAYFKSFHVRGLLDYVASRQYLREPNFQRFLSERADQLKASGADVNIWQ
jgi:thioredoxin-related protein